MDSSHKPLTSELLAMYFYGMSEWFDFYAWLVTGFAISLWLGIWVGKHVNVEIEFVDDEE